MKMLQVASFARSHRRLVSLIIGVGTLSVAAVALAAISSGAFTTASSVQVTTITLTINKPTVSTGDLMLATIAIHGGSAANISTVPTGWTQIARTDNDASLALVTYWKIDSGSEPSSYQWIVDGQTTAKGGITVYSGVNGATPVDASAGNTGLGITATTSAITTTEANDELVAVFALDEGKTNTAGSYFSTSTGMTKKFDVSNTPFGPSISVQEATRVTAGTAASKSSAIGGNNKPKNWAAQQIALKTGEASFDSSDTWTAPAGVTSVTVDLWGGGGGGGTGGGAGAYVHSTVPVTPGNNYVVTIGEGGTGAVAASGAGTGGSGYANGGNGSVGNPVSTVKHESGRPQPALWRQLCRCFYL
jgi:hypothetical protein